MSRLQHELPALRRALTERIGRSVIEDRKLDTERLLGF